MNPALRIGVILGLLVFVIACSDGFPPEFPAQDFSLKSPVSGQVVNYPELRGRPVIIYWFTSW